jgi:hypothetical protein
MAFINKRLQNANLTILQADNTALIDPVTGVNYTRDKSFAVTNIIICNNSAVNASTFDMHFVPYGEPVSNGQGSSNTATRVINQLTLTAEETFSFDTEKIILAPGDSIVIFSAPHTDTFTEILDPNGPVYGDTFNLTDLSAFISYMEI